MVIFGNSHSTTYQPPSRSIEIEAHAVAAGATDMEMSIFSFLNSIARFLLNFFRVLMQFTSRA